MSKIRLMLDIIRMRRLVYVIRRRNLKAKQNTLRLFSENDDNNMVGHDSKAPTQLVYTHKLIDMLIGRRLFFKKYNYAKAEELVDLAKEYQYIAPVKKENDAERLRVTKDGRRLIDGPFRLGLVQEIMSIYGLGLGVFISFITGGILATAGITAWQVVLAIWNWAV